MSREVHERHETHMSVVTVFAEDVLKVLKPIHYAFVDLSSEALRRSECQAEVAHNQPWAPGIYLGVKDVAGDPPVEVEHGEPAVWMRRLPGDRTLVAQREAFEPERTRALGAFIRARHEEMPPRPGSSMPDAVWGRIDTNLSELLEVLDGEHGPLVERLRVAHDRMKRRAQPELARRSASGRALHGDLRAEHVYDLGSSFAILDGVAFSEELASGDPIEDVAFLAMDLAATLGRRDLVEALWAGWGEAPEPLRSLYCGHRSLIRAKIAVLSGRPAETLRHLLHALVHWAEPGERPLLAGIGGLPGVGKSTLAQALREPARLTVLRTDVVRKELGPPDYSEAGRAAVYRALFDRARASLARGERVLVDASFGQDAWRAALVDLGRELGVPTPLFFATCSETTAVERIAARVHDPSDADASVHRLARSRWQPPSPPVARWVHEVSTEGKSAQNALALLRQEGLAP